jgi:hypothetical protein
MSRVVKEYHGRIEDSESLTKDFWENYPFTSRWEALREMLAFYYGQDLSDPNPFPVDRNVESYGLLSERWKLGDS